MKTPRINERHFFSTIIAKNKTLQIVLCHKRIISFRNSKFSKTKEKIYNFVSPQKNPQLRTLKLQTIAQKLLLTLDQKSDKLQGS